MLKIQIISNKKNIKSDDYKIKYSLFVSPVTFDLFDINIIDMQDESLWKYEYDFDRQINCSNDLKSLNAVIKSAQKSKIIILFPLNYKFEYYKSYGGGYNNSYLLKDRIENLTAILGTLLPEISNYSFMYENSITVCRGSTFTSSFCFSFTSEYALTKAAGSNKATTMQINDKCILTTLCLSSQNCQLKDFLDAIGLMDDKPNYPQWLIDFDRFDDFKQKEIIENSKAKIFELQNGILTSEEKLQKNLRLKSILTENGENLVSVVFDILQEILAYDLSEFKDIKKEDFLIKLEGCTFIGEIKGITSNVKNENVSQLDVHYQAYLEKLDEENKNENVKALLIVNPQRNKPISERDNVYETQIKLAKRNGSLIVPTISLLEIYEKFLNQQITTEQVIKMFTEQEGLIDLK